MISRFCYFILFTILFSGCDNSKFKETPIENFLGVWELQGRSMLQGVKINIEKNEKGEFIGKIISLNDNKYVKIFMEEDDVWIFNIKRTSNYHFKLTEKKIGGPLFSVYGLETSNVYDAEFIDENTIGLATGNSEPTKSSLIYKRVAN